MFDNYNSIFHPDRYFDSSIEVRNIAKELYDGIKNLPIISPHGHVNPKILAYNKPFPDPTELFLIPDHYIFRMLYSQGIKLEELGVPASSGVEVEKDHKKIWKKFAGKFYLFLGTPTGVWLTHALYTVFDIKERLDGDNAEVIYDTIEKRLREPDFLPRNLFEKFNIEVLSTTDSASDELKYHQIIKDSGWKGKVIPTFRPDAVVNIDNPNWKYEIEKLSKTAGITIDSFPKFISALEKRRIYFKKMGAVATDHGVRLPYTHQLSKAEVETIFQKALRGETAESDAELFTAHMLMEFAGMSIEDGLVMQIHPGTHRNHNSLIFEKFGADKGCDIPEQTEYTNNLKELLNKYGNDTRLTIIMFTLDESAYSRELAPLAGHYPALKLGPAWWFHDSIQGMMRYRQRVTETAGFFNTVGFNDDTRAFLSIPARHDVARRVDSNFLAGLVAKHIITFEESKMLSKELAYNLVKKGYKL